MLNLLDLPGPRLPAPARKWGIPGLGRVSLRTDGGLAGRPAPLGTGPGVGPATATESGGFMFLPLKPMVLGGATSGWDCLFPPRPASPPGLGWNVLIICSGR